MCQDGPLQTCLHKGQNGTQKKGVLPAHRFISARAPPARREGMRSPPGRAQSPGGEGMAEPHSPAGRECRPRGGPIPVCREYYSPWLRQWHAQSHSNTLLNHITRSTRKENIRMARNHRAVGACSAYRAFHRLDKSGYAIKQQALQPHPEITGLA